MTRKLLPRSANTFITWARQLNDTRPWVIVDCFEVTRRNSTSASRFYLAYPLEAKLGASTAVPEFTSKDAIWTSLEPRWSIRAGWFGSSATPTFRQVEEYDFEALMNLVPTSLPRRLIMDMPQIRGILDYKVLEAALKHERKNPTPNNAQLRSKPPEPPTTPQLRSKTTNLTAAAPQRRSNELQPSKVASKATDRFPRRASAAGDSDEGDDDYVGPSQRRRVDPADAHPRTSKRGTGTITKRSHRTPAAGDTDDDYIVEDDTDYDDSDIEDAETSEDCTEQAAKSFADERAPRRLKRKRDEQLCANASLDNDTSDEETPQQRLDASNTAHDKRWNRLIPLSNGMVLTPSGRQMVRPPCPRRTLYRHAAPKPDPRWDNLKPTKPRYVLLLKRFSHTCL